MVLQPGGMTLPAEVAGLCADFLERIDAAAPGLVEGLYLRGSLGFGEYFPGTSDVDFTAVLAGRPGPAEVAALAAVHAELAAARPRPFFSGFHVVRADLASPPNRCGDLPCMFEGTFHQAGRFDVNPVSWHELACHGVVVRGPALTEHTVWTDDKALHAFTHDNLTSYWQRQVLAGLHKHPQWAGLPETAAWCVLGVSRLHHLLATGALTSKSGAGRYALTAFGPRWRPIVAEALRAREHPEQPTGYPDDAARGDDTTAFTAMAVEAGLALG